MSIFTFLYMKNKIPIIHDFLQMTTLKIRGSVAKTHLVLDIKLLFLESKAFKF